MSILATLHSSSSAPNEAVANLFADNSTSGDTSKPASPSRKRRRSKSPAAVQAAAAARTAAAAAAMLGVKSDPMAASKALLRARNAAAPAPAPAPPSAASRAAEKAPKKSEEAGAEAAERAGDDPDRLARTVFVGNLPPDTSRKAVAKHFGAFGRVESVRIRSVASANLKLEQRAAVIKKAVNTAVRDAVNAYVVFADAAPVEAAVATNAQLAFGRHLRVDRAAPPSGGATSGAAGAEGGVGATGATTHKRSVFLGNLPFDLQEEAVWEAFSSLGSVEAVRLIRDPQTQQGKGFGYVTFADKVGVEAALARHETTLAGRTIRVQRCKSAAAAASAAQRAAKSGRSGGGGGVDWKNKQAAALRLQHKIAAGAKAKARAKGGIGKQRKGGASKKGKAGEANKKGVKAKARGQTASLAPSQLAQIKARKRTAAKSK